VNADPDKNLLAVHRAENTAPGCVAASGEVNGGPTRSKVAAALALIACVGCCAVPLLVPCAPSTPDGCSGPSSTMKYGWAIS
jgi:hypothetical protein